MAPSYAPVGFGRYAESGTPRTDYHVTTTSDTGTAGSLRHAWTSGGSNINIVFDVGGTFTLSGSDGDEPQMQLTSNVVMDGNTTYGSVTIEGLPLRMQGCDHIVVRNVAFRNQATGSHWYGQIDVNQGPYGYEHVKSHHILIDRCSFSDYMWRGVNFGNTSTYATVQWCFFGPCRLDAGNDPPYNYPAYVALLSERVSFDHCVFYATGYRCPGAAYDMNEVGATPSNVTMDVANCLMWSEIAAYDGSTAPLGYYSFVNVNTLSLVNVRQSYFQSAYNTAANHAIHTESVSAPSGPGYAYISGCKFKDDAGSLATTYYVTSPYDTTGYDLPLEADATTAAEQAHAYAGRQPRDATDTAYAADITGLDIAPEDEGGGAETFPEVDGTDPDPSISLMAGPTGSLTERVGDLQWGSLSVTMTSGYRENRATFTLIDSSLQIGDVVEITDTTNTYFTGVVSQTSYREYGDDHFYSTVTALDPVFATIVSQAYMGLSYTDAETTYTAFVADRIDPVQWYRLGESSGTTAYDQLGVHNGIYYNSPTLGVTGSMYYIADTAVTFNGTSQYVGIHNGPVLSGEPQLFIAARFKTTASAAYQTIWAERDQSTSTGQCCLKISPTGRPHFFHQGTSGTLTDIYPPPLSYADGNWHTVTVTMTGSVITIYMDGYQVVTGTKASTDTTAVDTVRIGADYHDGHYFDGTLDEVMVGTSLVTAQKVLGLNMARTIRRYISFTSDASDDETAGPTTTAQVTYMDSPGFINGRRVALACADHSFLLDLKTVHDQTLTWLNPDTIRYTIDCGEPDQYPLRLADSLLALG